MRDSNIDGVVIIDHAQTWLLRLAEERDRIFPGSKSIYDVHAYHSHFFHIANGHNSGECNVGIKIFHIFDKTSPKASTRKRVQAGVRNIQRTMDLKARVKKYASPGRSKEKSSVDAKEEQMSDDQTDSDKSMDRIIPHYGSAFFIDWF